MAASRTVYEEYAGYLRGCYQDVTPFQVAMREAVLVDAPYIIGDKLEYLEEPPAVPPEIGPRIKQRQKVNRIGDLFGNDGPTEEQAEYALSSISDYLRHWDTQP